MSDCTLLDWALFYNDLGLLPIPCKITPGKEKDDKTPLVKWKHYHTSGTRPEKAEIENWFGCFAEESIGIVTGPISGVLVLDVENKGVDLVKQYALPTTWTVSTRRGFHYYYRWPRSLAGVTTNLAAIMGTDSGVDTRGYGGFAVVPPSGHGGGGRYTWSPGCSPQETTLADVPEWLLALLAKPQVQNVTSEQSYNKEHWVEEIIEGVGDGERHAALVRLAGYYFNIMPPAVAKKHLIEWNEKNTPPMEEPEFGEQLEDLYKRFKNGEYTTKYKEPRSLGLMSSAELITKHSRMPEWLVPGFIPKGTRTIFSGWQGRGKSMTTTDLVIEIARKKGSGKWLGEFPVTHGPVIYIDNENGNNLVAHRMEKLLKPKGLTPEDVDLHWVIGQHWKITNEADYAWLREMVEQVSPVLVVVDSLASVHSLDENASKDMRYFFDDLVAPFCEEYKCGLLCIDHERKEMQGEQTSGGKRLRGSGAKGDAVDTLLCLNERDGVVYLEHSKARFSRRHDPFAVGIEDAPNGLKVEFKGYLSANRSA